MKIKALLLSGIFLFTANSVSAKGLLRDLNINGVMSLNWRLIGPRKQGFETQIQHEIYLADIYFGFDGKISNKFPFLLEFQIPSASQGRINLYRFSAELLYHEKYRLELGKFLVPFGYHNELYRPDQFLTVTRPLLYASPDSLDLMIRLNSPRPPVSSGYTDIGAKLSYYPERTEFFIPSEITLYAVNGLSEMDNRLRTFPNIGKLNVEPVPISGVNIDFGHTNNNLADNNNNKVPGVRINFALGDLRFFTPLSNNQLELKGVKLGFSGMAGRYDLEEAIPEGSQDYLIYGIDLIFQYRRFNFSAEYVYGRNDLRQAQADSNDSVDFEQRSDFLPGKTEVNKGFYLQAVFPLWTHPRWGEKLQGILVFNRLERIGPELIFSKNSSPINGMPIAAFSSSPKDLKTSMNKYTAGLNWQIANNFILKAEYSYWELKVPPVFNSPQADVYQPSLSWVFKF